MITTGKNKTHQIGLYCNYIFHDLDDSDPDKYHSDLDIDLVEDLDISLNEIWDNLNTRYMFQHYRTINQDNLNEFIEIAKNDPLIGHELQVCSEPEIQDHNGYPEPGNNQTECVLAIFPLKPLIKLVPQSPVTEEEHNLVKKLHTNKFTEIIKEI